MEQQSGTAYARALPDPRALSHAYLILALPEPGYQTARALAGAMICSCADPARRPCGQCRDCRKAAEGVHPDIITITRPTDDRGRQKREIYVEQIRALVADSVVLPNEAERKVYILRDADAMNPAAQNALLKLLEEPPRFVSFILVAESAAALLETVRSRCVTLRENGEDDAPSPEALERAERWLDFAAAGARVSLLSFANENAELGNAEMTEFAEAALLRLNDMLCGRLPDLRLPRGELMRLVGLMQTVQRYLRFNVSTKHVLGLLAADTVPPGR